MIIRKADQNETNTLLYMTINVMSESTMGLVHNDVQMGMNMFVPLLNSGSYYLIAVDQNQIAGWVLIGPDFSPVNVQKTGSITSLFVFPFYRKIGLGKQLMQSAIQQLKAEGFQKVMLNVYTGNPAKQLYENLGFTDISTVMELTIT
ncbi:GNAT family N-acetyltransferase [Metabacillus halosaccharovorans]|uniref:GNAT family N-acetyltransferase n=1 Tax=Metabacillus halosaccharovorans TaxID=930124 RepID=A0ABT3DF47_9BACI|nr:GNAT family N-acetyltransferase [Metabacillus halosaccharovorans]MCV9885690.1 GNAT family N-acetyltransferase [Metabacillus halosaccharovorans]